MIIAICDDEAVVCEALKTELYNYFNARNIEAVIETFPDGSSLINSGLKFDLVILDYMLPGIDGLQTAKELREKNSLCAILFLTNYPEIVYDTFEYDTFRFLVKPLDSEKLCEALDSFRQKLDFYYPITLSSGGEVYKIDTREIIYIEAEGKSSVIRLRDKSFHCPKTLSQVFDMLPKNCFFRTHRSFVVNLSFIERYNRQSVRFGNGEFAKISRGKFPEFQKAVNVYLSDFII